MILTDNLHLNAVDSIEQQTQNLLNKIRDELKGWHEIQDIFVRDQDCIIVDFNHILSSWGSFPGLNKLGWQIGAASNSISKEVTRLWLYPLP